MIKVLKRSSGCCDNCNRFMDTLMSEFYDNGKDKPYVRFALCEDCLNALSNMLKLATLNNFEFIYDMDEISDENGKTYINEFTRKEIK